MDQHRLGTCSSCNAQYRVPATFKANKAKCKKCGGVVELGEVQGDAPAPKPAPAKQARPARPAAKAGGGRGKQAPAAKRGAAKRAPRRSEPSPADDSVRAATEEAATRVRSSDAGTGAGAKQATQSKSGRSGSRRKGRSAKKQESKVGLVLGVVVLLVIVAGGGWFLMNKQGASEAQAAESGAALETADASEAEGSGEAAEESPTEPENQAGSDAEVAGEESALEDETSGAEDGEEQAPEEPAKPKVVDLSLLEEFGPAPGTSDEEWAAIEGLVSTTIDPTAGARGNRAGLELVEQGRPAFPAILNALKSIDYTTRDGYRNGDVLQKLLERICSGNNFGWRYSTEEPDVYFNKRVVEQWFFTWNLVVGEGKDGLEWIKIAKLDAEHEAEYRAELGLEVAPGAADELEDF